MEIQPNTQVISIFLGGTIDMGNSENWQKEIQEELNQKAWDGVKYVFYNPRRDDWDSSWSHDSEQFRNQVFWELDHLEKSDIVLIYLLGGSISPISLLEMGLHARSERLVVFCEEDFWRKGNVRIMSEKYDFPVFHDRQELIHWILKFTSKIS